MRHDIMGRGLQIVWWQVVFFRDNTALKQPPCVSRNIHQIGMVHIRQSCFFELRAWSADPPNPYWRCSPQQANRQGSGRKRRFQNQQTEQQHQRQDRLFPVLTQQLKQICLGRSLHGGGRRPLQQMPPADICPV